MTLGTIDYVSFVLFIVFVVGVSLYASRKQESSEDYFLAGRALPFWLIGFSLIASNISTEHFVGMAGEGFGMGLAIASYEWIAAITLVFVALVLLPMFLKSGIYTIPEYLEYRYSTASRSIMALYMLVAYIVVAMAAVLFAGSIALETMFGVPLTMGIWIIGILAGAYTIYGGLKAVVWSDLIQGSALLLGGLLVTILGLREIGGLGVFLEQSADKLHVLLPADHPSMPWTIMIAGIWIPNIFYWGLNQFITQRTLGAKSLAEGQRGILLAAWIKLIIPFIIVFPGIMAFQLYGDQIEIKDQAYPYMIKHILPAGLTGIMMAALFGAIMSSLDSMLNSTATIFTMDLYKRHIKPDETPKRLVRIGRITTGVAVIVACMWAPMLNKFEGVFQYIQMIWGFFSPGIVAVFLFGLLVKKAPPMSSVAALVLTIPLYLICLLVLDVSVFANDMVIPASSLWWATAIIWIAFVVLSAHTALSKKKLKIEIPVGAFAVGAIILAVMPVLLEGSFLNCMAITMFMLWGVMGILTAVSPLDKPVVMPVNETMDMKSSPGAVIIGLLTVAATVALYVIFR